MTEFLHTMLMILIVGVPFFIIGWNMAVAKHRAKRRALETHLTDLEAQVSVFHEERKRDPQRAWIDVGTRYATGQMEHTIERIRKEANL